MCCVLCVVWCVVCCVTAINKKTAFTSKDKDRVKVAQTNLKAAIRQGENKYRDNVENKLQECDTKGLWKGL